MAKAISISMAYGSGAITFHCSDEADRFTIQEPGVQIDPERFSSRLTDYLADADLDLSRPAVVVADKTRLCGYPQYLPVLLDALVVRGAVAEDIAIFIAYGTHAPQKDDESFRAYGPTYGRYRWVHHQCDGDHFIALGDTRRGTPVYLPEGLAEASAVITFGAICHHYFAGYGGGRKLIFPGLGKREAIYANHSLFLDRTVGALAAGCSPGQLAGNPLAEDLADYAAFRSADLAIHGILDSRGSVCDLLVGQGARHFEEACRRHASHCEVAVAAPYDLVVASCGGFPKDINFIQSHKAVHHAAAFVRDGGRLVVLAECREDIGSHTFLPWFELGGWQAAFDALACGYVGNGGTALAMMTKTRRIRIALVSQMKTEVANAIGVELLTPPQVQTLIDDHQGTVALIPNASMLVRSANA